MINHIAEDDLERYYLRMVTDEAELAPLEEHLLWCGECLTEPRGSSRTWTRCALPSSARLTSRAETPGLA